MLPKWDIVLYNLYEKNLIESIISKIWIHNLTYMQKYH